MTVPRQVNKLCQPIEFSVSLMTCDGKCHEYPFHGQYGHLGETNITYLARVGFAQKSHKVPPCYCVVVD